jgi:hypothetical protein
MKVSARVEDRRDVHSIVLAVDGHEHTLSIPREDNLDSSGRSGA